MYDPNERLQSLWLDWRYCRKCELSNRRTENDYPMVFGEGALRGIMFIGEGPGKDEEVSGRPFVGKSGKMLRGALRKLGLQYISYITNAVCCRSCGFSYLPDGTQEGFTRNGVFQPRIKDKPPKAECIQACLPRLYEQIYLVDPFLIVCLGADSAKLLGTKVGGIVGESGKFRSVDIPGHVHIPQLTEKKRAWARKQGGVLIAPIELNQVQYLMMPLIHPSFALKKSPDLRKGNPLETFCKFMKLVGGYYRHHVYEMTGERIPQEDLTPQDLLNASDNYAED